MTISVIMYKNLGISNTDIALYTSWLYLPWVIKPFLSPVVDLLKTKRWWIVSMQLLVGAGLAGIAFTIPMSNFFQTTLAIFWQYTFMIETEGEEESCQNKGGLQKWLWPMAWSLSLTCLTFVYLGYFQPQNF